MVNKVLLIGNLTADPEVKALPSGVYVAKIRLATNTYAGKDDAGKAKEKSEFHSLVAFGKTAEFAGSFLKKGRSVYVEGRLQTSSWADAATGQKKYRTEVVVEEIKFVGPKPAEAAA
jgi:single-strand DNA-binding protein